MMTFRAKVPLSALPHDAVALLASCALLGACTDAAEPAPLPVSIAIVSASGDTLMSIGDSATLSLSVRDAAGFQRSVRKAQWTNLNTTSLILMSANEQGAVLQAASNGTARVEVQVTYGTGPTELDTVSKVLTVQQRPDRLAIDVRGMPPGSAYGTLVNLSLGGVIELVGTPLDARDHVVPAALVGTVAIPTFASDDASVATISAAGLVRGTGIGRTTVRAKLPVPWGVIEGALPIGVGVRSP